MTISEAVIKRLYELCNERQITINKLSTISGITQGNSAFFFPFPK